MKSQNASAERRFSPRGMKVAIRAIGAWCISGVWFCRPGCSWQRD